VLDHMTFRVSNLDRTVAFYASALAALGYTERVNFEFDDQKMAGFGTKQGGHAKMDTWFVEGPSPHGGPAVTTGCHLCWSASSRAQVDAFYAALMEQGAKDNGAPGLREHYHPNYYGAFVIDPDGNNVEAACHAAE
jgi:catechol 2,3-dioxygenase-like lactoylglutathione lyase family enzyme